MPNGYIAIISAIILSAVLMLLAIGLSLSSYFNLSDIQDSNLKDITVSLAEGCAEVALLKMAFSSSYSGNENLTIASSTCAILPVESSSTQKIIKTQASFANSATNLKITISSSSALKVLFWEEY